MGIIDTVKSSLQELFFIRYPQFKKEMPKAQKPLANFLEKNKKVKTIWIYYPWLNKVIRSLSEEIYFELRTARNRNIITKEEQENYRNCKVGLIGLSVGSNILLALVLNGGPKTLKITDPDTIEISNLNRLRAPLSAVGMNKTVFASQQIWEIDPFADLHLWPEGINEITLEDFILSPPQLDILIDEMDNLSLKVRARQIARRNRIPVIMATNKGDNILIDIERFDLEPNRPILHNLIKETSLEKLKTLSYQEWVKISTSLVGKNDLSLRLKESLKEIGKTIAAVPQLGTTALISGSIVCYLIRKIANKEKIPSGRYSLNWSKIFNAINGHDL